MEDTAKFLRSSQMEGIVAAWPEERAESRTSFDPPIVDYDFSAFDFPRPVFFDFLWFGDLYFEILDSKHVINKFSDLLIGGEPFKATSEHDLVEGDGWYVGKLFATPNNKISLHYLTDIEDEINRRNVTKYQGRRFAHGKRCRDAVRAFYTWVEATLAPGGENFDNEVPVGGDWVLVFVDLKHGG